MAARTQVTTGLQRQLRPPQRHQKQLDAALLTHYITQVSRLVPLQRLLHQWSHSMHGGHIALLLLRALELASSDPAGEWRGAHSCAHACRHAGMQEGNADRRRQGLGRTWSRGRMTYPGGAQWGAGSGATSGARRCGPACVPNILPCASCVLLCAWAL